MAGQTRRIASMLGLVPDTEDDEYYDGDEPPMAEVREFPGRAAAYPVATPADAMHRIVTVRPRIYRDARAIGEPYREGVPVIMNLTDVSDADSVRLVDFASGLVLALQGKLERITPRVFLLSPASVEVTQELGEGRTTSYDGH